LLDDEGEPFLRLVLGGGARSRKAVHWARMVSNVSTSSWMPLRLSTLGNSMRVKAPLSGPRSQRGMR
jgi:hypothetical protein